MSLASVVASFLAAWLLSSALNQVALLLWQRHISAHWTERARRLYPIRMAALVNPLLFAAVAAITMQLARGEATVLWLPSAVVAWLGAAASGYVIDRRIWPGLSFKKWARQFVLYWMLFRAGLFLTCVAFFIMPPRLGWQTWVISGALLMLIVSLTLGLTISILLWTQVIQAAPVPLHEMASRAAARAGASLRKVWVTDGAFANAFALLPMNDMLFSDRLLQIMSEAELESICAHEATHLTESKWVFCGRLMGAVALCPLILFVPVTHHFGLRGVLVLLATTMALVVFPRWLGRRMEQRADAAAAAQAVDPADYARALEKLYQANLLPAVMPKRSGLAHPDLYDRMLAAGVTPSYERPRAPGRMSWTTFLLSCVLASLIVALASVRPSAGGAAKNDVVRAMLLDDAQDVAPQEETAVQRDRIPRGRVEEINTISKREMETARAMPLLAALTQIANSSESLAQGIGRFRFLRHQMRGQVNKVNSFKSTR